MDWTIGVRFPVGAWNFSLLHSVQTGYGALPSLLSKGQRVCFAQW